MKTVLLLSSALLAVLCAGCNQGVPGGPGTAAGVPTSKTTLVQADDTFNLSADMLPTSIKQGERISTSVGIKRGKNFDEEVELKFTNVPTGIRMEPSSPIIKHGDTGVKLLIAARKDAALGDFIINITGHPSKGTDADIPLKLSVKAN